MIGWFLLVEGLEEVVVCEVEEASVNKLESSTSTA